MFSRTILRTFLRTRPRSIPRAIPHIPRAPIASPPLRELPSQRFIAQCTRTIPQVSQHIPRASIASSLKQPSSQRLYSQYPRGYPPPRPLRRRVWGQTNHEEELRNAKPLFSEEQLYGFRNRLPIIGVVIVGGCAIFYFSNLETVPISGRRRFNCFSEESVEEEGKMMYDMIMREEGRRILPDWDRRVKMVKRVMERLIPASGVSDVAWEVHVIDSPERNAFVIPGGKVFVYTGILPITKNDDGLAAVLGHEIAHNVARHQAETLSTHVYLVPIRFLFILGDYTGYTLGLGRFFGDLLLNFGLMLPASRKQENEADYIGLLMMAKSCYDPTEAVRVWQRMEAADKEGSEIPQWLSTHPSNAHRIEQMQRWLPEAETARQDTGCAISLHQSQAFQDAVGSWAVGNWTR